MKKINLLFIIILATVVTVTTMFYFSNYVNNPKRYEEDKILEQSVAEDNKAYIPKEDATNDNQGEVVKKVDEVIPNTKGYLEKDNLSKEGLTEVRKNEDKRNKDNTNANSSNTAIKKDTEIKNSGENYNYYTKEEEQSVFKVSTGKIVENLTTSDKIKLLYVSFKVDKESYEKMEEYLHAEDAEEGVLKALRLLKKDLSIEEYEKVRKIAGKFIDMDAAESLY